MKRCLKDCYENHPTCIKLRQQLLDHRPPKYLLDLESVHGGRIRIQATERLLRANLQYAILSYCWGHGGNQATQTTSENLQQRLVGFSLTDLPKTIRDAVNITQVLGLRYLWVDALCIQQDSDNRPKQQELAAMPDLYAKATIVISAACATHCDAGFLGPRDLRYHQYDLPLTVMDEGKAVDSRIRLFERSFKKERDPIDMRIWTEPERNNAVCSLRFESEQVEWQCRETTDADSDVGLLPPYASAYNSCSFDGSMFPSMLSPTPTPGDYEGSLREYVQRVSDFSARKWTRFDDRLVAFERTAMYMAKAMGWDASQYKAGLWMKDMQRGLLWCRDGYDNDNSAGNPPADATSVPSWSWASIPSAIIWDDLNCLDWGRCYTLEVLKCEVRLQPLRPYAGVKRGSLFVKGYALEVFWNGQT
jgi:hypothetical protein